MATLADRLNAFATNPLLKDFATGAVIDAVKPVQSLLAPLVGVLELNGRFKKYSKDTRLKLPKTQRGLGGAVTQISRELTEGSFSCELHSLDERFDAAFGDDAIEYLVKDALLVLADIGAQVDERDTINKAIEAAGAGTTTTWDDATDPVKVIDDAILARALSAKSNGIAVVFGTAAWGVFKNHPKVLSRVRGDLSWQNMPNLFQLGAQFAESGAIYDTAASGLAESLDWLFPKDAVLIFARTTTRPNRRDASFMKTFATNGGVPQLKLSHTADERVIICAFDWAREIKVTNESGVTRYNVSTGA